MTHPEFQMLAYLSRKLRERINASLMAYEDRHRPRILHHKAVEKGSETRDLQAELAEQEGVVERAHLRWRTLMGTLDTRTTSDTNPSEQNYKPGLVRELDLLDAAAQAMEQWQRERAELLDMHGRLLLLGLRTNQLKTELEAADNHRDWLELQALEDPSQTRDETVVEPRKNLAIALAHRRKHETARSHHSDEIIKSALAHLRAGATGGDATTELFERDWLMVHDRRLKCFKLLRHLAEAG